jgi:CIC family chloride channel protein
VTTTPQTTPQPNVSEVTLSARFWLATVLTGAGAGLAGGLLMRLLRLTQHLSFHYRTGDFLRGVEAAADSRRVLMLFLAGLLAAAVLYALHRSGEKSGDLSGAIWQHNGRVPAVSTLIRSVLSILTVGMGVALGREGALKDTGAVVANKISDLTGLSLAQQQVLAACGAGAGMAAAYNVPLGGALFAAEVLLGSLTLANILPALVTSLVAVAISWFFLPDAPAYTFPTLHTTPSLILWSLLAGPLLGLASVAWVRAVGWAETDKPQGWHIAALPILIFTALGLASIKFPQLLGNGKNIVQLTFNDQIGGGLLWCLILLRPLASVLCLRTGTPGGLFTPTMTLGALLGDALGHAWNHIAPFTDPAAYALIASAGFLAAATLGPLSSAVFLLELTRRADALMVPLLLVTAGATITARRCEIRSIYSARITEPPNSQLVTHSS